MEIQVQERIGAAIQAAIDQIRKAGGGKVTLLPGTYVTGTLYLCSNLELHLMAGAVLQGYGSSDQYDDFRHPGMDNVTPEGSRKCLLACADAENVAITGLGRIDGQGPLFYDRNVPEGQTYAKPPYPRPRMVQFFRCRNVRFEGVTFHDSPGWTFWLVQCEEVRISGIRITGDQQMPNHDGIDIDSCRKVAISDSFFQTGDDCLILRAIRQNVKEDAVCELVNVTNCVLDSRCQGIRLGCPSDGTIRHCSFQGILFRGKGSGIHCEQPYRYLRKGDNGFLNIHDVSFEDFDIQTGRYPIRFGVEGAIALRGIRGLTFRNFRIDAKLPIYLEGNPVSVLEDIALENISGVIHGDTALHTRYVRNLQIENLRLTADQGDTPEFKREASPSWETKF